MSEQNLNASEVPALTCPNKPNCVSSRALQNENKIEPIKFNGSIDQFKMACEDIFKTWPRITVLNQDQNYLHLEVKTAVFKFVDDLELYFDSKNSLIHVRSASRKGHYDLGTNRNRVEKLRSAFAKWCKAKVI